jgi:hypothetical protein
MGFFTNLRLRRKLLIAMVPLVLMVVVAGVYSSFESNVIDNWYSVLIDTQVKALRSCFCLNWLTRPIPIADKCSTDNWKRLAPTTTRR